MSSIGFRIKTLRKSLKMNQKDFSNAINISQGTLSDIENDKSYPAIETLLSLFGYIEISADWLLKGKGICFPEGGAAAKTSHDAPDLSRWKELYLQAPEDARPYLFSLAQAFLQALPIHREFSTKHCPTKPPSHRHGESHAGI